MRPDLGFGLSAAGVFIIAGAVVCFLIAIVDAIGSASSFERDQLGLIFAAAVLGGAFGLALRIIGRHLSSGSAFLFPQLRAFVASRAGAAAALTGAIVLWVIAAWFISYLIDLSLNKPAAELEFNFLLGIPFGILIPIAAGFALFAATRITSASPTDAGPPREAIRLLAHALTAFGVLWLAFAGVCTATSGFSGRFEPMNVINSTIMIPVLLSFAFGAVFAAVGMWLRRVSVGPM